MFLSETRFELNLIRIRSAIHRVLNVFPTFLAATTKDDDYDREGHRCRRCIFWLRGNFYDTFGSIGNGHHLFCFFLVKRASELSTLHWAGSKLECVELCNFHFCCELIFCQPMKKFEFLGVSRATRQRHFKTSSTGDENEFREIQWRVMEVYSKSYRTIFLKRSADCVVRAAIINNYIFGDDGESLELKRIVFKPCEFVVSESYELPKYCCRSCCETHSSKGHLRHLPKSAKLPRKF